MNSECAPRTAPELVCRKGRSLLLLLFLSFAWLLALNLSAIAGQAPAATPLRVEGTVTDQRNAPIAGAEVTLTIGKFSVKQVTEDSGSFVLDGVPAGNGLLTVHASGFATFEQYAEHPISVNSKFKERKRTWTKACIG